MDTLESEEDSEKKRKLEEMCEGKLTRPSEDALFLRKEIIDALRRSDEKTEQNTSHLHNAQGEGRGDEITGDAFSPPTFAATLPLGTCEESVFLQREIIDAIRQSDEKVEAYSRKSDEKMDTFLQKITDSVGTQLHGMNSTILKMKEEEDDRYKQISERITNIEKENP